MFKKLFGLIKKIYITNNYILDQKKKLGYFPSSDFLRKNIIFFYELGCFLQKKKLNFFSDIFFSIPYFFYTLFRIKKISFCETCYLFNSDKSLSVAEEEKNINLSFALANNYDRYFNQIKNRKLKILEIGIGGHNSPHHGGSSLRALSKFFKRSEILGIDIVDKKFHERKRIKTFMGSQIDENFLKENIYKHGPFDIIIDDGSHYVDHQNLSFKYLFPHLNVDGIYIIEDMLSAYMNYMGGSTNLDDERNLVTKFSQLTHNVYSEHIFPEELKKLKQNDAISSIQFYSKNGKGCIIIEKSTMNKNGNFTRPEFKLSNDEIKKDFPDHPHNQKMSSGLRIKK